MNGAGVLLLMLAAEIGEMRDGEGVGSASLRVATSGREGGGRLEMADLTGELDKEESVDTIAGAGEER